MKVSAVALGLAISVPLANAYSGDLTHYTPNVGSCGITNTDSDAIVALSTQLMANGANPNNNPICNKQISIHNPTTGTDTIATVTDTCTGCAFNDIDATISLFNKVAPNGDGRVHGIQWTPIGWTVPGGSGGSESPSSAVQPSAPATAAAAPPPAVPSVNVQEKVAAAAPSAPASSAAAPAESSSAPSVAAASPSAASPSAAPQPSSAPTTSSGTCTAAGETVCSADGTQIGICTTELTVEMGPVASGTKCAGGYMVMANSRLRSRRG